MTRVDPRRTLFHQRNCTIGVAGGNRAEQVVGRRSVRQPAGRISLLLFLLFDDAHDFVVTALGGNRVRCRRITVRVDATACVGAVRHENADHLR